MKALLAMFLVLPLLAYGQKEPEIPRLAGIVNLPDFKRAVFELKEDCCSPRQLVLTEGESMWGVTLLSISPVQRTVKVAIEGLTNPIAMALPARSNSVASISGIELVEASIYSVLELYGQFAGKTLLYWPRLPTAGFSLQAPAESKRVAAKILHTALGDKRIAAVADGDKFMMIVPADQVGSVSPHAPRSAPGPSVKTEAELVPPGTIAFHGVMLEQAYFIYANLIGANLDRSSTRPKPIQSSVFLYTQTPLSREEAIYAFDTIFGWQGIRMVRAQDGSVRPVEEAAR